ncbi:MAG: hypothetical protein IJQ70_00730 [Synergistaceae bacterium]|nr:hypothetical protein [Synergistaceae bacterium]
MIIGNTTSTYSSTSAVTSPKPKASQADSFEDILTTTHEHEDTQPVSRNTQTVNFGGQVNVFMSGNAIADNGVKSAVMMGRLSSQEAQSTGAISIINLTDDELQGWHNAKLPEGWRQTNAGGVIFSGGTRKYSSELGVYYTDGAESDYQFGVFYDENSQEDNPVVYLRKTVASTYSELDSTETIKIEVSKVNPSNASYKEMIALAGYIYRDDPKAAFEACEAIDMAREAMQADGLDWQNGTHDYTSYYLPEVVRRYKEYDPELSEAADILLEYLKDYPRGITEDIQ